jgi:APA family basic amino acid/polyamine antiporter
MSLLRRKSLEDLQRSESEGALLRVLGPWHLVLLGVGGVIGAGIFSLTGLAAATNAGPAIVISFLLAGFACAMAGLCYSEMASMIPIAGSAYTYSYATMGELIAWIIGWDLVLEYAVSAVTVAIAWSSYATSFLADFGLHLPARLTATPGTEIALSDGSTVTALFNLPAVIVSLAITAILIVGIRESAGANAIIVAIKVAVIAVFVVAGWSFIDGDNLTPLVPPNSGEFGVFGWSGVLRAAGIVFFAYIGFDAVSTAAQEARNPQRDMPIGMLGSLAICTLLYILVSYVLVGLVDYRQLNVADPIAVGIEATGIGWLQPLVKLGALMGLSSVILVSLLGQSRIFFSMSRDGLLPPFMGRTHERLRTPHLTLLLTGGLVALAAAVLPLRIVGELVSIGTLFAFLLVSLGVWILRRTRPDVPRPFRTPWVPLVPIVSVVSCLALMLALPSDTWIRLVVWLAIGLTIFFLYGRHHSVLGRREGGRAPTAGAGAR